MNNQRKKELTLNCKLNEKNVKMLADAGEIDPDLGMAVPTKVQGPDSKDAAKAECPSHELLKEKLKGYKKTWLM